MKHLISCEYNFDNCCVELKFTDGSMIAIDTIAVENEVARNMYERSELDYLIYNAPLEYACNLTEYLTKRTFQRETIREEVGYDGKPREIKGFDEFHREKMKHL